MTQADYLKWKLESEITPFDYHRVMRRKDSPYYLVDVRDGDDQIKDHKILGAVVIPPDVLKDHLSELPMDKTIVVYCWSNYCHLGLRASLLLAQNGFKVKELLGGIRVWDLNKFPVEPIVAEEESEENE